MKKSIMVAITLLALLSSCTDNERARTFGGTETVDLMANERFINITWKDTDLWVVVQDTITGNYIAREKSAFGVWEGKIIIKPTKARSNVPQFDMKEVPGE